MLTNENLAYIHGLVQYYRTQGCQVLGEAVVQSEGTDREPGVMALALLLPLDIPLSQIGSQLTRMQLEAREEEQEPCYDPQV